MKEFYIYLKTIFFFIFFPKNRNLWKKICIIFLQKLFWYSSKIEIQPQFTLHEKKQYFFKTEILSIIDYKKILFSQKRFFYIDLKTKVCKISLYLPVTVLYMFWKNSCVYLPTKKTWVNCYLWSGFIFPCFTIFFLMII